MVLRFRLAKTTSGGIMARSEFGGYVAYEDYQKLEAELEQLRQQVKESYWIEWGGGDCPVTDNTKVQLKLRDGDEGFCESTDWQWFHTGGADDIIAYRIVRK